MGWRLYLSGQVGFERKWEMTKGLLEDCQEKKKGRGRVIPLPIPY